MELRHLRHALTVGRTGSFAIAAEMLGLTQPALSRSIMALEESLGTRLFDRGRGGAQPTRAGELLLRRASALIDDVADLQGELRSMADGLSGHVRFGIGPLPAEFVLAPLFEDLTDGPPALRVTAEIGSGQALLHKLAAGQLDFALCGMPAGASVEGVQLRSVVAMPLALLGRGGHPLAGVPAPDEEAVGRYPILGGTLPEGPERGYRPCLACDDYGVLARAALASDALIVATPALAQLPGIFSKLAVIEADVAHMGGSDAVLVLATRTGRIIIPAARCIMDRLEMRLRAAFQQT